MKGAVYLERRDATATIWLNRPEVLNAFTVEMSIQFAKIMRELSLDKGLRLVLLRGQGRAFSAGGDIKVMAQTDDVAAFYHQISQHVHDAILLMRQMMPLVMAVCNGPVSGIAFGIICACDMRLASDSATFHAGTTRLGLAPNGSLSYYLPQLIGRGRAERMMLTGHKIDAASAEEWGLVQRLAPHQDLEEAVQETIDQFLAGAPASQRMVKKLLTSGDADLAAHLIRERDAISETARSKDFREGLSAFLEKRKPQFKGQ